MSSSRKPTNPNRQTWLQKPVFLDPTIDWAFKRIFGSKESHDILVSFLNDLLNDGEPVIQSLTIIDPYLPARLKNLKETAVDVRAVLADGSEKLIEMQVASTSGFLQRLIFNAAKALVNQLRRGANYRNLRPVTVIAITNFKLLPGSTNWFSRYNHMECTTGALYPFKGIEVVIVELPTASTTQIPTDHPMRDWLNFLISAKTWRQVPKEVTNPQVRQALGLARVNNLSPKEAELMTRRQLYHWDQVNMRSAALEEGRAEGEAKGEARGKAEFAVKILTKRLGPLPKKALDQIAELDFLQLEMLADRVLDFPTVKSVESFLKKLS